MKFRTALISAAFAATGAVVVLPAATASAAQPSANNCWGVVSSQRASTAHDIGEHASAQESPRMGLGNTARFFGLEGPGELGSFLATVDGDPNTTCN
jgi:hypothetical protein